MVRVIGSEIVDNEGSVGVWSEVREETVLLLVLVEIVEFLASNCLERGISKVGGERGGVAANIVEEISVINCFNKDFNPSRAYSSKGENCDWFFCGKLYEFDCDETPS